MTPGEYLKNRVEQQINWYDRKSTFNKRIRTIIRFFAERFVANIVCTGLANPQ